MSMKCLMTAAAALLAVTAAEAQVRTQIPLQPASSPRAAAPASAAPSAGAATAPPSSATKSSGSNFKWRTSSTILRTSGESAVLPAAQPLESAGQPGVVPATAHAPIARVTPGPDSLPSDAGQESRDYDITPYTARVTSTNRPEQAILDWILRETGYEAWHTGPGGLPEHRQPPAAHVPHARDARDRFRPGRSIRQHRGRVAGLRHARDHAGQPQLAIEGPQDAAPGQHADPGRAGLAAGQGRFCPASRPPARRRTSRSTARRT